MASPWIPASGRMLEVPLRPTPVLIAGRGNGMLDAAGRCADRAMLWAVPTSDMRRSASVIESGATAGREAAGPRPELVWAPLVDHGGRSRERVHTIAAYSVLNSRLTSRRAGASTVQPSSDCGNCWSAVEPPRRKNWCPRPRSTTSSSRTLTRFGLASLPHSLAPPRWRCPHSRSTRSPNASPGPARSWVHARECVGRAAAAWAGVVQRGAGQRDGCAGLPGRAARVRRGLAARERPRSRGVYRGRQRGGRHFADQARHRHRQSVLAPSVGHRHGGRHARRGQPWAVDARRRGGVVDPARAGRGRSVAPSAR